MAQGKYFGTDGIRGAANGAVLNPGTIVRIGLATAQVVKQRCGHATPSVVIGKDPRLSGYMIESALQSAFTSMGFTVLLVGPLPTPAVAMLTRSLRCDVGVMITASHNPYEDNGIKLFTPDGIKANGAMVAAIEALVETNGQIELAHADHLGKAERLEDAVGRYMEYVKTSVPGNLRFDGLKVALDCANGAAYKIAPRIFWELGAEVVKTGVAPDGFNINHQCGATHPATVAALVKDSGAHVGLAFDGDADRLIMCDEHGTVLDGDTILAAMAQHLHRQGKLQGGAVVATVMSNLGLEEFLGGMGLKLIRTPVGDHYVEAAMREHGCNLGGEQSGHLIFRDFATTGDGMLAALQVLAFLQEQGRPASSLATLFTPWPQRLENIKLPAGTDAAAVLASSAVQAAIASANTALGTEGRTLVRKSGTEPLIRVMVEARTQAAMDAQLQAISQAVRAAV
ncbi:MAG: phosphoglucosamine mutase [Alphaproteobacteria bacterium]|nr:phosphoglucosamine mutase [Alphaproteobacteria bacterium]